MRYNIDVNDDSDLSISSDNNLLLDADNVLLGAATLGNELVTNPNMETMQPPVPYIGGWSSYLSASLSAEEYEGVNCCKVTLSSASGGIRQSLTLVVGKRYKMVAIMRGYDLPAYTKFKINWNGSSCEKDFSNTSWVKVEKRFVADDTTADIEIFAYNSSQNAIFYIDSVSVKEIEGGNLDVNGDISAGGSISGNSLSPNFFPALFGIHGNAEAKDFSYNNDGLLTHLRWTSSGKPDVEQNITYYDSPYNYRVHCVITTGGGRTVTETLTWDTNDRLSDYTIAFS